MKKTIAALLFSLCGFSMFAFADKAVAGEAISAQELFRLDFEEIQKRSSDGIIVIKGVAVDVGPNRFGLPSVTLSDVAGGAHYVLCVLPYGDYAKMGDIEEGEEITMTGSLRAKSADGILVVKNCVVVP